MKQRIYITGAGVISHHHAQARRALPRETELYAADPSARAREGFLGAFPDAVVFDSSEAMLAHSPARDYDIVCVATPPKFHYAETIKALQSGRNVICEKPFAMNMEEARKMVGEANRRGLAVACCSNRFIGWSLNLKVKEILNGGGIGEPYLVDFIHRTQCGRIGVEFQIGSWWFTDKSESGGGTLMDWGPYDMSCLVAILEPEKVTVSDAITRNIHVPHGLPADVVFDVETQAVASLRFELKNGRSIVIRYERTSCTHGENHEAAGLYGTGGFIKWQWLPFSEHPHLCVMKTKAPGLADELKYPADPYPEGDDWMFAPLRELDRHLRGEPAQVLVNEKALQPFSLLQAIYDVAESGAPISLDFTQAEFSNL